MVLKLVFAVAIGATLLACGNPAVAAGEYRAEQYRADEFLGLDLSKVVLSPKPLGPATQFAPRALAKSDPGGPPASTPAKPEAAAAVAVSKAPVSKAAVLKAATLKAAIPRPGVKKPHGAGRVTLARRHRDPLDAQAFDTRIQVWPCRSGGICNWQRP
jgi:hypothetical protein